jgi:hypothetical protein
MGQSFRCGPTIRGPGVPIVTPTPSVHRHYRRVALTATTALLLSATVLVGQPPRSSGPPTSATWREQPLGGGGTIGPDALRQMAEQLKALQGAEFNRKLIDDIRRLHKEKLPDKELIDHLLRSHPELRDQQRLLELDQLLRQSGVVPNGIGSLEYGDAIRRVTPATPDTGSLPTGQQQFPGRTRPGTATQPPLPPPPQGGGNVEDTAGLKRADGSDLDRVPNLVGMTPDRLPTMPTPGNTVGSEQLARRQQQFQAIAGWWEKNVGPLDETPALRQLLQELITGRSGYSSDDGTLGDLLDGPTGERFGKLADRLASSGWKLPELGLGKGWGGGSSFTSPSTAPGTSFGGVGGVGGGSGSWLPVVALLVVAAVGLVFWWLWPKLMVRGEQSPRPLPGLGPWPVDPRTITDREALVKAFEYLSILVCGAGARAWNHVTIAAALERAAPHAEALAEPLAKLYAMARYTPADEPLPPNAIVEAREYLCELAGVSA